MLCRTLESVRFEDTRSVPIATHLPVISQSHAVDNDGLWKPTVTNRMTCQGAP